MGSWQGLYSCLRPHHYVWLGLFLLSLHYKCCGAYRTMWYIMQAGLDFKSIWAWEASVQEPKEYWHTVPDTYRQRSKMKPSYHLYSLSFLQDLFRKGLCSAGYKHIALQLKALRQAWHTGSKYAGCTFIIPQSQIISQRPRIPWISYAAYASQETSLL